MIPIFPLVVGITLIMMAITNFTLGQRVSALEGKVYKRCNNYVAVMSPDGLSTTVPSCQ